MAIVAFREYLIVTNDALLAAASLKPDRKCHMRVKFPNRSFKPLIEEMLDLIALATAAITVLSPSNPVEATLGATMAAHPQVFWSLVHHPDTSHPLVYSSQSLYIGETMCLRRRRWEHVLSTLRALHKLKAQPLVHNTKVARLRSMSQALALIPIATASPSPGRRRLLEAKLIHLTNPPHNRSMRPPSQFGFVQRHRKPRRLGASQRRRQRPHPRQPRPLRCHSWYSPHRHPRALLTASTFTCQAAEDTDDRSICRSGPSPTLLDLIPSLCPEDEIAVQPGRLDLTDWVAVTSMCSSTMVQLTLPHPTSHSQTPPIWFRHHPLPISYVAKILACRPPPFSFQVVSVSPISWLPSNLAFSTIKAHIRHMPPHLAHSYLINLQGSLEAQPKCTRYHTSRLALRRLYRCMHLHMLPPIITVPCPYHHHMDRGRLCSVVKSMVQSLPLTPSAKVTLLARIKPTSPRATKGHFPQWFNLQKWTTSFSADPWPCCPMCSKPSKAPRAPLPGQPESSCISFSPLDYPEFCDNFVVLGYSHKTQPFPTRVTAKISALSGISKLSNCLVRFGYTPPPSDDLARMASACVRPPNRIPLQRAPFTTRALEAAAVGLQHLVVGPHDKNPGLPALDCPRYIWHLYKKTFEWEGPNPLFHLVTTPPADIVNALIASYPFSDIAPIDKNGTLPIAEGWRKFSATEVKHKMRPLIRCHTEPHHRVKSMVTRAGVFAINSLPPTMTAHLAKTTQLRTAMDRVEKWARSLPASTRFSEFEDDAEGCYNNMDVSNGLKNLRSVLALVQRSTGMKGARVPTRSKLKPVQPSSRKGGTTPSVIISWNTLVKVVEWATGFRYLTLGTLTLSQIGGFFQGCPISVLLTLASLMWAEYENMYLSQHIKAIRFVDDKWSVVATSDPPALPDDQPTSHASVVTVNSVAPLALHTATSHRTFHDPDVVMALYNSKYDATLTIKRETPFIHQSWLFLGRLVFRRDTPGVFSLGIMHFNRNVLLPLLKTLVYPPQQFKGKQIYWSELHHLSYQPRSSLLGQRLGRLMEVGRSSDPPYRQLAFLLKLYEYRFLLHDPPWLMHHYCRTASLRFPEIDLMMLCKMITSSPQDQLQATVGGSLAPVLEPTTFDPPTPTPSPPASCSKSTSSIHIHS